MVFIVEFMFKLIMKNGYIYISAGIRGIQISQNENELLAETQHHQICKFLSLNLKSCIKIS